MKNNTLNLANELKDLLDNEKGEEILVVDLKGKSDFADFMIVATGLNKKHVATLGEKIAQHMKTNYKTIVNVEGLDEAEWVLVDCFDIIIHIFQQPIREHYKIEDLWNVKLPRE
ncbi:MAG: ribosome silencing factor [Sphingobacteriia bacterium]|nr:ribosome silencing factor [Sphingobacteriia bacterium]